MVWGTVGELLAFRRFPFLYIILFSGRFNYLFRYRFKLFEAFERAELAAKSRRPMSLALAGFSGDDQKSRVTRAANRSGVEA